MKDQSRRHFLLTCASLTGLAVLAGRGFAGGHQIESAAFSPLSLARLAFSGAWGPGLAAAMSQYTRLAAVFITGEDPARPSNGIFLHPSLRDRYGLPVPIVRYTDHENAGPMRVHAANAATALFGALGATSVVPFRVNMATHNLGTCRMSRDAGDGVCDMWGRSHEVDNLYVSDGSLFPSSGSANPTLTIVALAIRQAEHIRSRMTAGEL